MHPVPDCTDLLLDRTAAVTRSDDSEQACCWVKPAAQEYANDGAVPCMPSSPFMGDEEEQMSVELGTVTGRSLLDTVLLALWEDCAEKGLFRYDVTACATKVMRVPTCLSGVLSPQPMCLVLQPRALSGKFRACNLVPAPWAHKIAGLGGCHG